MECDRAFGRTTAIRFWSSFWVNNCYQVLIELLGEQLLSGFDHAVRWPYTTKFKQAFWCTCTWKLFFLWRATLEHRSGIRQTKKYRFTVVSGRNEELLHLPHDSTLWRQTMYIILLRCISHGDRKLNRKNTKDMERFHLCLFVRPFPVSERIWNHLGHAGSLHFSDVQPCSGQTPFPVSAIHSNQRTNENNLNGKRISLGGKDGDTPNVCVGKPSRWDQDLDRRFNLFPYPYQTSYYAWINKDSKLTIDSQSKLENTTFIKVWSTPWDLDQA